MTKGKKEGDKSELLTKEEMDRLIDVVSGSLYFTTLYKLLRYTGRRIGEIYGTPRKDATSGEVTYIGGIRVEDIDFNNGTVKTVILKTKKRKMKRICNKCKFSKNVAATMFCMQCGNKLDTIDEDKLKYDTPKEIIIALRPEAMNILRMFIQNHKPKFKNDDYIFRQFSLIYLQKSVKRHVMLAKINKKFSLHGFRTYVISNMIRNGLSEEQIIKWTGHTSTTSLGSYNRLIPQDIQNKVNEVDL